MDRLVVWSGDVERFSDVVKSVETTWEKLGRFGEAETFGEVERFWRCLWCSNVWRCREVCRSRGLDRWIVLVR